MLAAARLSFTRGLMTKDDESRLATLIREMGPLPPVADLRCSDALDVIGRDKKVVSGRLHFVLARGIGATEIVPGCPGERNHGSDEAHRNEVRLPISTNPVARPGDGPLQIAP